MADNNHHDYIEHLDTVARRTDAALDALGYKGLLVASGSPQARFLDDQSHPFRVNPHFAHWLPVTDVEHSFVLYRPGERPVLLYYQPQDYWHQPAQDPQGPWVDAWDIQPIAELGEAGNRIGDPGGLAFIGEQTDIADAWSLASSNDPALLARLHFDRGTKTAYEIDCIRSANNIAVRGHLAAAEAFAGGASEFEIHIAFERAVGQREQEAPYSSIIALNEHCAVLHYQHYAHAAPATSHAMLIDAGASYHGYAADITRTYAARSGLFKDLVSALDEAQRAIIAEVTPGLDYAELHQRMHWRVATLLRQFDLVQMTPEAMVEQNITSSFLPHGLGHLLGLQTHDVGGFQQDYEGSQRAAPDHYPALRFTREISEQQVFTIEPGIYFIPMLLEELSASRHASVVNFPLIETLLPCGGIRIEDNIAVIDGKPVNLTREAFAASAASA